MKRIEDNVKNKVLDDNRLYCTEILTILLSSDKNIALFLKYSGMDRVIATLSVIN